MAFCETAPLRVAMETFGEMIRGYFLSAVYSRNEPVSVKA